jgi:hypothetical protein
LATRKITKSGRPGSGKRRCGGCAAIVRAAPELPLIEFRDAGFVRKPEHNSRTPKKPGPRLPARQWGPGRIGTFLGVLAPFQIEVAAMQLESTQPNPSLESRRAGCHAALRTTTTSKPSIDDRPWLFMRKPVRNCRHRDQSRKAVSARCNRRCAWRHRAS